MNDAITYWNQLAPAEVMETEAHQGCGAHPGAVGYEGRHRDAGADAAVDAHAARWLRIVDHADELQTMCIENGLGQALSLRVAEAFVRTFIDEKEADR
jgi:hypothetical protein